HTACFFLSSRRRHTRFSRDWSSDVCSSDLGRIRQLVKVLRNTVIRCLDTLPFVQQETRRKAWLQIQVMLGYFSFAVVLLGYRFAIVVVGIKGAGTHHHKIICTNSVYEREPICRTPGMRHISGYFYSLPTIYIDGIDRCVFTCLYTCRMDGLLVGMHTETPGT